MRALLGHSRAEFLVFKDSIKDFAIYLIKLYCVLLNLKIFAKKYDDLRISLRAEFTFLRAFFELFCKIFTPDAFLVCYVQ